MPEAIEAFTLGAAKAVGEGTRRGTIAPGMDADLTVLDGPIATVEDVRAARVALTIVGGRIVYGR
jgi:predicted amidohydrolase YtcJ